MKLAIAPVQQLISEHPTETLVVCLVWFLLTVCFGCWWISQAKAHEKMPGLGFILLIAINSALPAGLAGAIANREIARHHDFANAKSQYERLDSEREQLYERVMQLVARVDQVEDQTTDVTRSQATDSNIQQLLQTSDVVLRDLNVLQEEAQQQHSRAKQIRAQYRELSIVVHTGKMLAELDKQVYRIQQVDDRLKMLRQQIDGRAAEPHTPTLE